MADNKPVESTQNSTEKTTLILVIVFGSVSVLLLGYIALRLTIGPRFNPNMKKQVEQYMQRRPQLKGQSTEQDKPAPDPMNFDEETNLN